MRGRQFIAAVLAAAGVLTAVPATADTTTRVPDRYLSQRIQWKPCFAAVPPGLPPGSERLECGSYHAPRDWNRPDDQAEITVAVSRLRPPHGPARGTVLTNPGGPGGPGRTTPLLFLGRRKLVEHMEIIGIDVRGTGDSTNATCGGFDALGLVDPRDRGQGNLELLYDSYELQAKFCQVGSGEFGRFVNTEQTVRDLDLLRHLLGRQKINWVGYSGGTWLGAFYATYFPNRVDKFVLDSNTEFTSSWQTVFDSFSYGFERRFRTDFLPWVAKYDAVYHLGTTGEQVRRNYEYVRAKLAEEPLVLPDLTVTAMTLDLWLILAQYSKHSFPPAAQQFATVRSLVDSRGSAVASLAAPDAPVGTRYSILCNDTPFQGDRDDLIRQGNRNVTRYPLIGGYQISAPCAFWNRPPLRLKTPDGHGVPPVLMVQSERDPATPLEGAQRAHQRFRGSRLLTVTDEGDHGIYAGANACVNDIVEAFLVDGTVPQRDLTCPGEPLPTPGQVTAAEQPITNPILAAERLTKLAGELPR